MKPASYRAPGSMRLGKDGIYVNCCAACQSFNNLRNECRKHDFTPAKGGRCEDYVDVFADENLPNALAAYMAGREGAVGTDARGGFESLAALLALRDQLLQAFDVMEQEPLPERYSDALPELAADIDRLADWLDGQRQWVAEVHGQQRMARWQEMLERVSRLPIQERLLIFPLLRSKWERIYALNGFRRDRIGLRSGVFLHSRVALTVLLGFIRTAYVMLERFPAALGHWYELAGDSTVVEIVSLLPLVGRDANGREYGLEIEQLGECLTA